MAGGPLVNFYLETPLFGAPGFLQNAAPHATQIALGAVLGLVIEATWLGVAITAFPHFYARARALTLWFGALALLILTMAAAESAAVMSMVSVSEAYLKASGSEREQIQAMRVLVASGRNWVHFLSRIADGAAIFVFYAVLYRLALVPRWLAGFGLIAAVLMITGIGVTLFGHDVVFPLLAPLGLAQLTLALWLLAKGFRTA